MGWEENFKEGKEVVLATCSKKGKPNANIVISLGFVDNKLLVADCQMKNTIKNLKNNPKICIVGGYCRLLGKVEILDSGKYFDICVEKSRGYKVRHALVIEAREAFELDQGKKLILSK